MQGTGNDFVFLFKKDLKSPLTKEQVMNICERRTGIGADGLVILNSEKDVDFSWDFYNADGGMVNMCGNAARCAGFLWSEHTGKKQVSFNTKVGTLTSFVDNEKNVEISYVLKPTVIKTIVQPYDGKFNEGLLVDTGVPHCVVQVNDLKEAIGLEKELRPFIFSEEFAEQGANLTFFSVEGSNQISSISYERGVNNFTLSCGTGAMAATFVFLKNQNKNEPVDVVVPGGRLNVKYDNSKVFLKGEANIVYRGYL